jgi:type II secretory pathway predicted ATPase ExeA
MVVFGTPKMFDLHCSPVTKQVIKRMNNDDINKMIEFRLQVSGSPQLFSKTAMERIYNLSGGNPRKVVNWCRVILDSIIERGKSFVDASDVDEIVQIRGGASFDNLSF